MKRAIPLIIMVLTINACSDFLEPEVTSGAALTLLGEGNMALGDFDAAI